jgi:SagB-type dehydrogenase family enzyme
VTHPAQWDLLGRPQLESPSELFHENSKVVPSRSGAHISPQSLKAMTAGYKTYESSDSVPLPTPVEELSMPLGGAMRGRRSARAFTGAPVDAMDLSALLFYAYGQPDPDDLRRLTPSGGGLFPLEVYLAVMQGGDLGRGLYHYDVRGHALERIAHAGPVERLQDAVFVDGMVSTAGAVVAISAVFGRTKLKYGERGYRFALMEAGHVAQNVSLAAVALGLGACPIGGFYDDLVNHVLDVDGVDEAALYMVSVGTPSPGGG